MAYGEFGDQLTLQNLARYESMFRQFQSEHPWLIYAAAFVAYVAVTGLSLPGAAAMTLLMGWLFGFVRAVILVSFASTAGASLAFLLSRYLLKDAVQHRFGDRLAAFNAALEREGAFYLFTLRLIPAVPFFVINVVMGLTPLRLSTFWWVSQLGMLPGTCIYVYAGSTVPSLQELANKGVGGILRPGVLVAFAVLGLFPLVVKRLMGRLRPPSNSTSP
uniref:TVP38/TMEM64 family membrane protein n=1 Tax=Schlesneria paludicola TaxID=360056 RepID=A0A7C2NUI7_9PLAN